jgi:hypothetical protein
MPVVTKEEFYHTYAVDDIWKASPTCFPVLHLALTTPFQDFAIEFMGAHDQPFVQFKFGGIRASDGRTLEVLLLISTTPEELKGESDIPATPLIKIYDRNQDAIGRLYPPPAAIFYFAISGKHSLSEVLDVLRGTSRILPFYFESNLLQFSFRRCPIYNRRVGCRDWM